MEPTPALAIVAAVARNGIIGSQGDLVWREPQDLKHLRALTLGHPVLMGRRTWDSLPPRFRPLPGRRNLVLTRQPRWHADGAEQVASLDQALARCADAATVFVIGGAAVYALALPRTQTLHLTEIDAEFEGDTEFPAWDRARWREVQREPALAADGTRFAFVTYARR